MLLKFGGPYHGFKNGEVREFSDEEGAAIVAALGADSGRVEVLGDLRAAPAVDPFAGISADDEVALADAEQAAIEAAEEAELAAEIAAEQARDDKAKNKSKTD